MECKILVIEKIETFKFFIMHLRKQNSFSNLSVEQVLRRYAGFEGACLECIEGHLTQKILTTTCLKLINSLQMHKGILNLLYLGEPGKKVPQFIQSNFEFVGYEYGFFKDANSMYSSIFNEILFGDTLELINFNKKLNLSLLFEDLKIAEEYARLHEKLYQKDDGPLYEEMRFFEVWKCTS
jgi:hypothetical protein